MAALLTILLVAAVPVQDSRLPAPASSSVEREMSTDRPDVTESPYTVPRGRMQVELSLVEYAEARGDMPQRTLDVLPINLKFGLADTVDLQLIVTPYRRVRESGVTLDGFGDDTQLRLKVNLWGNDGGRTALAVMPFVKLPTGGDRMGNGRVEGGLIVPLAVELRDDFSFGTMLELDLVYDDGRRNYGIELVHSATLGRALVGELSGYVEYVGTVPRSGGGSYQAQASSGLTYQLSDDWMLDAGGTLGLSGDTDRFTLFAGTSFRF